MIEEPTISAGNLRPNGKGTKKKPISATISSPEKLAFLKIEGRPKMMRERNWMICLRIKRIAVVSQVGITCDAGVWEISFGGPAHVNGGSCFS